MKENINLNRIAEQRIQTLRQSIKNRIEYSKESIGSIEKAIGVSEGYFSRIWKKGKTPDLFNICKFVEYMEIDYNLLFFPEGKKKALDEQMINKFLKFVEIETMEAKLLWERRINVVSKNYVFSCKLEDGEELKLYKIILEDENYYKLALNDNLLYTTEGNENNIESNRIVKSLYQYLCENDYDSGKKLNSLSESIEIIKKYIKED